MGGLALSRPRLYAGTPSLSAAEARCSELSVRISYGAPQKDI